MTVPVTDYACEIDTDNAKPIAYHNPTFGPRKLPIIEKVIAKLVDIGHVKQIHDSAWLSKPLLAPEPRQENVTDIDNFVWHFCVNYIALSSVTKLIAMPIPRCNSAIENVFGNSQFRWLTDTVSGYKQIRVEVISQGKLAFAGPNCSKFTHLVMPFGLLRLLGIIINRRWSLQLY